MPAPLAVIEVAISLYSAYKKFQSTKQNSDLKVAVDSLEKQIGEMQVSITQLLATQLVEEEFDDMRQRKNSISDELSQQFAAPSLAKYQYLDGQAYEGFEMVLDAMNEIKQWATVLENAGCSYDLAVTEGLTFHALVCTCTAAEESLGQPDLAARRQISAERFKNIADLGMASIKATIPPATYKTMTGEPTADHQHRVLVGYMEAGKFIEVFDLPPGPVPASKRAAVKKAIADRGKVYLDHIARMKRCVGVA